MTSRYALQTAVVLLAALAMSGGSCNRMARRHPLTLEANVHDFHTALKNQKFGEAASFVAPEHRAQFLATWERVGRLAEFHDLDVTHMDRTHDADYAHVECVLTYVARNSLTVQEHKMYELWRGEGTTWMLADSLPPPALLMEMGTQPSQAAVPAPEPPPPPAKTDETFGGP